LRGDESLENHRIFVLLGYLDELKLPIDSSQSDCYLWALSPMKSSPTKYASPALAEKIAKNYGTTARKLRVNMVGAEDVSKLVKKVQRAQVKTSKHAMQLD